jgi:hypothetical protein
MTLIDHRTPLNERWGGWYVTGFHGDQEHMGNAVAADPGRPVDLEHEGTRNVTNLAARFDVTRYLSADSDIVALMTFEHQARMTNLLVSAGAQFRASEYQRANQATRARLDAFVETLVTYMLFADEMPLSDEIEGTSTFARTFSQVGPRDSRGRSLRDFDLRTRLFRYPLSYMIYSQAFDGLPNEAKALIYQRLYDRLTTDASVARFNRLSSRDRAAILDIVRETKQGLPPYWTPR